MLTASQIIETTPRLSVVRIHSSVQTATLTRMRGGYLVQRLKLAELTSAQVNTVPFAALIGYAQVFALLPLRGSLWSLFALR